MSINMRKCTFSHVHPRKTQINLHISLQKHAYSNILKILPPNKENFQIKNQTFFHISAQNTDCGYSLELPRWGGSKEYSQSMFRAEIREMMYTPVNPSFTIQVGFKGVNIIQVCFRDVCSLISLHCLHEESLNFWLSKCVQWRFWSD